MNTLIEARIARVARGRGCSFYEAASLLALRRAAKRRAAVRQAQARQESNLTRLRGTWHWRRDFE
jgi:hypothetical protein